MDKSGAGRVPLANLLKSYNVQSHPRVLTREKNAEKVYNEFETCIGARAQGSQVSESSFLEYYSDINACLPAEKDDYFVDLVLKTWGLNTDKAFVSP